jgi:hypothetical protein
VAPSSLEFELSGELNAPFHIEAYFYSVIFYSDIAKKEDAVKKIKEALGRIRNIYECQITYDDLDDMEGQVMEVLEEAKKNGSLFAQKMEGFNSPREGGHMGPATDLRKAIKIMDEFEPLLKGIRLNF